MHTDFLSDDDEYDSDEPVPLVLDLNELSRRASIAVSRTCTHVRKLTKGRFHEIFLLFFNSDNSSPVGATGGDILETEWSCIARVSREPEKVEKLISEVETMQYVGSQTSIPVPEVYAYDFEVKNNVGAQFILMERMPGRHLYQIWDKLKLDHKKTVLSNIANILAELSKLKFDKIGCLNSDNKVGPLLYRMGDVTGEERTCTDGPFESTLDYFLSFLNAQTDGTEIFSEVEAILESYMSTHRNSPALTLPFRLIHADFDAQNLLFTGEFSDDPGGDDTAPPCLSGVIDWEYAYTGPLYFLYEYPIFIQDSDDNKAAYADNAILRPHFVRALRQCFPKGSTDRTDVETSMKKDYTLNWFHQIFIGMAGGLGSQGLKMVTKEYLCNVRDGTGKPYWGRIDYVSDEEVLSDD
jgi:Ser/Thr protein kinase RdoA (MazF antagonist)